MSLGSVNVSESQMCGHTAKTLPKSGLGFRLEGVPTEFSTLDINPVKGRCANP